MFLNEGVMKFTLIEPTLQKALEKAVNQYKPVMDIVHAIDAHKGRVFLVGGAVRDLLLGLPVKDLDCEVHALTIDQLENILRTFGPVSLVGKMFGVLRVHGLDIDWSLPRTDTSGRKPDVKIDPHMQLRDAFIRRDLTINAMGIDLTTFQLVDPFSGIEDIKHGVLRSPDPQFFTEDPLRFYRVMQFVSRFEMYPDDELNALCKKMDVSAVSAERIEDEFKKMWLRSKRPSLGLRWLKDIGRIQDIFPEIAATIGIQQKKEYHPEGDVFEHTMQALDAAAALEYETEQEKLIVLYAALCHDLGKATTTIQTEQGWRSLGHETASVEIGKKLLKRITRNKDLITAVLKLVEYHMLPIQFVEGKAKAPAYKRLARKLAPDATLQMLGKLATADKRGRNDKSHDPLGGKMPEIEEFLAAAAHAQVLDQVEEPVLLGRDIIDIVEPGARMGELLKHAYEIQIEEGITDKEELKKRVLQQN